MLSEPFGGGAINGVVVVVIFTAVEFRPSVLSPGLYWSNQNSIIFFNLYLF